MKKTLVISLIIFSLLIGSSADAFDPRTRIIRDPSDIVKAPSGLSAIAVSASQINLSWRDNSSNEVGFKVERSLDGQNFSVIAQVGSNTTFYSNTGLSESTTYHYRVRAFSQMRYRTFYSGYSNTASATTFNLPLVAPSNLTAAYEIVFSSDASDATTTATTTTKHIRVKLEWQDNSDNETGFIVQRSTDGVNYVTSLILKKDITQTYDYFAKSGVTYHYFVQAYNDTGGSTYSNIAVVTIP